MRSLNRWLLIALLTGLAAHAAAQEAQTSQAPDAQAEASTDESSSEATRPSPETSGKPSAEVFVPSEEISEDFAVSFPVDI